MPVVPTPCRAPRGGGLGVLVGLLPGWAALLVWTPRAILPELVALLAATLVLAWMSFRDDRKPLPPALRFAVQIAAIAFVLAMQAPEQRVFQGALPLLADRLVTGIGWLWFVNLFNFMDGIDGISAIEAGAIGLGTALIAALAFARAGFGCLRSCLCRLCRCLPEMELAPGESLSWRCRLGPA